MTSVSMWTCVYILVQDNLLHLRRDLRGRTDGRDQALHRKYTVPTHRTYSVIPTYSTYVWLFLVDRFECATWEGDWCSCGTVRGTLLARHQYHQGGGLQHWCLSRMVGLVRSKLNFTISYALCSPGFKVQLPYEFKCCPCCCFDCLC